MRSLRIFLMTLGHVTLITAIWGGLVRIGWYFPSIISGLPGIHGPLIVCGFVGTYFSLERAVTRGGWPSYLASTLIVFGSLVLLLRPESKTSPLIVALGSVGFVSLCLFILKKQFSLYSFFITIGCLQWLVGN